MSSEQELQQDRGVRKSFLRLYEDFLEVLNDAVEQAGISGLSQAEVARRMGKDPAFLNRVLHGEAGTNLRTIGAVLYATNYRVKLSLVSCAQLKAERYSETRKIELKGFGEIKPLFEDRSIVFGEHVDQNFSTRRSTVNKLVFEG